MNIISIYKKYPTQESCIKHLESIRWKDKVTCAYCGSTHTGTHNVKGCDTRSGRRFQCQDCKKSFSVTVGTIFHHTHLELQKWFLAISLILNANKEMPTRQLARDLVISNATITAYQNLINAGKDRQKSTINR